MWARPTFPGTWRFLQSDWRVPLVTGFRPRLSSDHGCNQSPTRNDRFKVSSLLARRLGEHQVSLPAVFHRAALPAGFFQQEKIYVTAAKLFALWQVIGETRCLSDLAVPNLCISLIISK